MAQNDVAGFASEVREQLAEILDLLTTKNAAYGDSALDPIRIFSRVGMLEGLLVRIDDKLSRIARSGDVSDNNLRDLIGYLVMLRIAQRREK